MWKDQRTTYHRHQLTIDKNAGIRGKRLNFQRSLLGDEENLTRNENVWKA